MKALQSHECIVCLCKSLCLFETNQRMGSLAVSIVFQTYIYSVGVSPRSVFRDGFSVNMGDKALVPGTPVHMQCRYCASAKKNIIYLNSTCLPPF